MKNFSYRYSMEVFLTFCSMSSGNGRHCPSRGSAVPDEPTEDDKCERVVEEETTPSPD
ncbi:hypothetical protein KPB2_5579 [Klebsiella pneumoniae Kb677]|nr:hypothetical protein KPB2_5579 [Klebsiella pneumoniae Kb677]